MKKYIHIIVLTFLLLILSGCGQEVTPSTEDVTDETNISSELIEDSQGSESGDIISSTEENSKHEHTSVVDAAVAPTCSSTGLTEGSHCSECGEVLIAQKDLPKTEHTSVVDAAVAPTCTAMGLTEGSHCSVCNEVIVAQEPVEKVSHSIIIEPAVAASCFSEGSTEWSHCSVCNETITEKEVIPKTEHKIVTDPAVAATCSSEGYTESSYCSVCNEVFKARQTVKKLDHTKIQIPEVKSTCTKEGKTAITKCSVCNEILEGGKTQPKASHTLVKIPGKNATCTATGLTDGYSCSVCKAIVTEQQEIPMLAHKFSGNKCTVCGYSKGGTGSDTKEPEPPKQSTEIPKNSTFSIHFIDVGQADAALIECDGHYMLIDGGNKGDSNVIYSVLKNRKVSKLDIVVATHGHEDHVGGLAGAYNYTTADITLCPIKEYDSDAFADFKKYATSKGGGLTVPKVGETYSLGSAEIKILGVNSTADENNRSIVLMITYGKTKFLFTGDAERDAEQTILNSGVDLSATVLKVGHHGSDTSTTYPFLREIMPKYAVISVGEDNSYGHPTEDTLSRLRDADVKVYRTDMQGDIHCTSDGKTVVFSVEKNKNADTLTNPKKPSNTEPTQPKPPAQTTNELDYILNTKSKKFHYPSCSRGPTKNIGYFTGTRDELIAQGYSPCGFCNP